MLGNKRISGLLTKFPFKNGGNECEAKPVSHKGMKVCNELKLDYWYFQRFHSVVTFWCMITENNMREEWAHNAHPGKYNE